jgi:hypothetical protein
LKNGAKNEDVRPYLQCTALQLSLIFKANANNVPVLRAVYFELLQRRSKPSRLLREMVLKALAAKNQEPFFWPSTEVVAKSQLPIKDSYFQHKEGIFSYLEYKVGWSGTTPKRRQILLDRIYLDKLPKINSVQYMSEWGDPQTASRLKKMAESIASFARNAKRRNHQQLRKAILDWENDLNYLRCKYYNNVYDFGWPEI